MQRPFALSSSQIRRIERERNAARPHALKSVKDLPKSFVRFVSDETKAGMLLVVAALLALAWANSPIGFI